MPADPTSVRLFSLGNSIEGAPSHIDPSSFKGLDAEEFRDIERWIKKEPELLGEELCIVASQLSEWDKTSDRPDLIALDRQGKVVVIEIKRDQSGRGQDLQAIRYAAYASTIGAEDLARLFQDYRLREHKEKLSPEEARSELEEFVLDETFTLDDLDEDESPRMALVARHFHPGVTATALWLNRNFEFSISCVQIVPYRVEEKIVLASTVLIPLPEAADYEVRLQKKRRRASAKKKTIPLDYEAAREFIDSIPTGRWASYGDVAAAAGNPLAGQPIGSWLMREDIDVPHVYRVLTRHGHASPSWKAKHPDLPATPEAVHERLAQEGVEFDEQGRASQAQRWSPDGTG